MIPEIVTPEGLRLKAEALRTSNVARACWDSTARHLELAAAEIERLQKNQRKPAPLVGDAEGR
jgi:hypothetical protein